MNKPINALVVLVSLLAGCTLKPPGTAPSANYFYINPDKDLCSVGTVAVVELDDDSDSPGLSEQMTATLFEAVQKRQLFSLFAVARDDPAWRNVTLARQRLGSSENCTPVLSPGYSLAQLAELRKTLNCNAILTGRITHYRPYPHMAMGLRLRMIDLRDGRLLWALEQVWDTTDKTTQQQITRYFYRQIGPDFAPLGKELASVSPLKFMAFVAYEVAATLGSGRAG